MERLTKEDVNQMGMLDLSHNQVFVKNHEAWYRDFETEISARDLAKKIFDCNSIEYPSENEEFDEYMFELMQDGHETIDGMIALYYNVLWSMADIRERLKAYEDTGLTPQEFTDLQSCLQDEGDVGGTISDLIELMHYRKLEEQSLLIKLPCKLGDTVYTISYVGRCDVCNKNNQNDCRYSKKENFDKVECAKSLIKIQELKFEYTMLSMFDLKLRKNLYLTKEEAEKELERLNKSEVEQ